MYRYGILPNQPAQLGRVVIGPYGGLGSQPHDETQGSVRICRLVSLTVLVSALPSGVLMVTATASVLSTADVVVAW
jgi:hypothetical protein